VKAKTLALFTESKLQPTRACRDRPISRTGEKFGLGACAPAEGVPERFAPQPVCVAGEQIEQNQFLLPNYGVCGPCQRELRVALRISGDIMIA